MEDYNEKVKVSVKKRSRKRKSLEFEGWGSKNLNEFLKSLGVDITNRISEYEVTSIVMNYIRENNREKTSDKTKKKRKKSKIVACDTKLRLLFECAKINVIKVPDLVEKHYVENQDDSDYGFLWDSGDDEQKRVALADKVDKQSKQVVQKPKGTFAAIVSDNIKLLYLRKSLVQELEKTPETFEGKVMGAFVRIKNPYQENPYQLVQVTGVKEGNLIDGHLLQVKNYLSYLNDVHSSGVSDDDFSQEECEELHQRMKNGLAKRLTVVELEEKARSLHEDVTKHWLARELLLLQRRINHATEKGWRRELSQYLEKRTLLQNPEEQSRLLSEVPEVVVEELEPECVDDDENIEDDFVVPNPEVSVEAHQSDKVQQLSDSPVSSIENPKFRDGDDQPTGIASADDKDQDMLEPPANGISQNKDFNIEVEIADLDNEAQVQPNPPEIIHKDVLEPPANGITQKKDSITKVEIIDLDDEPEAQPNPPEIIHEDVFKPPANGISQKKDSITKTEPVDFDNEPQVQPNPPEIIELSSDDDEEDDKDNDDQAYEHCDPEKVMWLYELSKGKTYGPYSLTALKEWNDKFFAEIPDFKVWKSGNNIKSAVLLTKLLQHLET